MCHHGFLTVRSQSAFSFGVHSYYKKTTVRSFLFLCLTCFLLSFTVVYVLQWKYVPENAQVKYFIEGEDSGVFTGISGGADFDPEDPTKGSITAEIAVKTINSGSGMRDESLLSKDFFEEKKYPKIKFVSESITKTDTGFIASGKLTIKNITKPLDIPFKFMYSSSSVVPGGTFKGGFTINRYDFGVGAKGDGIAEKVRIELEIPVQKK